MMLGNRKTQRPPLPSGKKTTPESKKGRISQIPAPKILGSGSYGTVFQTADPTTVRKNFTRPHKTSELKMRRKQDWLRYVDPYRLYFGGTILQYQTNPQTSGKRVQSILMINQGHSVRHLNITDENRFEMARHFQHLLKGLVVLSEKGFIHGDITMDNIMYNPRTGNMKFIDYDFLCRSPSDIDVTQYYYAWPPELMLDENKTMLGYSYFPGFDRKSASSYMQFCMILSMNAGECKLFQKMMNGVLPPEPPTHGWLKKLYAYLSDRTPIRKKYKDRPWVKDSRKIDIYSLGIVALQLFGNYEPFLDVIFKMIEPDPDKRISPEVAFRVWDHILYAIYQIKHIPVRWAKRDWEDNRSILKS